MQIYISQYLTALGPSIKDIQLFGPFFAYPLTNIQVSPYTQGFITKYPIFINLDTYPKISYPLWISPWGIYKKFFPRCLFFQNSTLPHGRTKGEIYAQAPPKGCFQKKKRVTVAPKISAERAAANAPIIINRDSQLFKNYQQQRLPRQRTNGCGNL